MNETAGDSGARWWSTTLGQMAISSVLAALGLLLLGLWNIWVGLGFLGRPVGGIGIPQNVLWGAGAIGFAALDAWCGVVFYLWARAFAPYGGGYLVRSEAEARIVVNLTTEARAEYETAAGEAIRGMDVLAFLVPVAVGQIVWPLKFSAVLGGMGVTFAYFLARGWLAGRAGLRYLVTTEYARARGITEPALRQPIWNLVWIGHYYGTAIAELDSSPFEPGAR